jgi:hypothetical protein
MPSALEAMLRNYLAQHWRPNSSKSGPPIRVSHRAQAGSGFVIHSSDPNAEPTEVLTHNDMESHFAAKIIGFMGKTLNARVVAGVGRAGQLGGH